jgi:hypothetical protein
VRYVVARPQASKLISGKAMTLTLRKTGTHVGRALNIGRQRAQ